ncbi:hypothetical protein EVAR_96958_1 [Eumeta japonica]|uniref:Uncharacterized protein n=1 Tax=Eumeta variegata TaxID=151549 RepID=A0A4C1VGV9_EUMVA|nr:hypothetical protein EVAR_96958_1 [Eumeta japonica]
MTMHMRSPPPRSPPPSPRRPRPNSQQPVIVLTPAAPRRSTFRDAATVAGGVAVGSTLINNRPIPIVDSGDHGGQDPPNPEPGLRYKQFAKAVTKSTFNLSSLPPTQDTARFHTFRVYHQVQSWLGNYNDPEDWGWKKCGKLLMPVQNSKPPAPPELLKLIFCKCKGNCGAMCGCQKAGMKCSAVCFHCSGETCSNVMELSELINENDFDDEPPTLTPLPSPVLPLGHLAGEAITRALTGPRREEVERVLPQDQRLGDEPRGPCVPEINEFLACAVDHENLEECRVYSDALKDCKRKYVILTKYKKVKIGGFIILRAGEMGLYVEIAVPQTVTVPLQNEDLSSNIWNIFYYVPCAPSENIAQKKSGYSRPWTIVTPKECHQCVAGFLEKNKISGGGIDGGGMGYRNSHSFDKKKQWKLLVHVRCSRRLQHGSTTLASSAS